MSAFDKYKKTIIDYISDPENEFPTRTEMALDIVKYKNISALYKIFTRDDLAEIEREGLDERRKRYSRDLSLIDRSMITQAQDGDIDAAKLIYDRLEGSVPQHLKHQNPDGSPLEPLAGGIRLTFVKAAAKEPDNE